MNQTDGNRQRDQEPWRIRWQWPLLLALFVPTSLAVAPRYWYVTVVIAGVNLLLYVQFLRIENEKRRRPSDNQDGQAHQENAR